MQRTQRPSIKLPNNWKKICNNYKYQVQLGTKGVDLNDIEVTD